jgi:hypothetical protein
MGQAKGLLQINYERGLVDGVTFKEKELYQHYSIAKKYQEQTLSSFSTVALISRMK